MKMKSLRKAMWILFILVFVYSLSGCVNRLFQQDNDDVVKRPSAGKNVYQDIPIVGDWVVDFSGIDQSAFTELMIMVIGDQHTAELVLAEFGVPFFLEPISSVLGSMVLRFESDNTCSMRFDPNAYRTAYVSAMDKVLDALAQMDLKTVAKVSGKSLEEFQKQLDREGKTWPEKCEERKIMVQLQVFLTVTDEFLCNMYNGFLNENGIIEITGGRYFLEGNRLSFIDTDPLTLTISYRNQVITIEKFSENSVDFFENFLPLFKGMRLRKMDS